MSSTHWTPSQEAALTARGGNLLLSAAAGSGKTAVLVERVIRRITDPVDPVSIDSLLILTFTRAAAGEMRTRIATALSAYLEEEGARLREDPTPERTERIRYLKRQLTLLAGADISTIDSFCQSILRRYFYLLDIDPDFKILSEANEIFLLEDEVLSEVLLRHYEAGESDFTDLVDLYAAGYRDANLRAEILRIYSFTRAMAFPDDFIAHLADPYDMPEDALPDTIPWVRALLSDLHADALLWKDSYRRILRLMDDPAFGDAFAAYQENISEEYAAVDALAAAKTWDEWYRAIGTDIFKRLPGIRAQDDEDILRAKDEIQSLRTAVKEEMKKQREMYFSVAPAQWARDMAAARPLVSMLSTLLLEFHDAYMARKKKDGLMEFHDMEHYALQLLLADGSAPERPIPSETALALRAKYREVMLDEYQDTNGIQELITVLISDGENRFLVGDLKQSIYRFRQADPTIFLGKYESFPENDLKNRRIDLNLNFRSDAAVLSATNHIFRQLLQKTEDGAPLEIGYGEKEALYPGRKSELPADYIGGTVDISLVNLPGKDAAEEDDVDTDLEKKEIEARLIARTIQNLVASQKTIQEKDGSFRPVEYRDIVILVRAAEKRAGFLQATLADAGIPTLTEQGSDFFASAEIQILLALLRLLDNPHQDLSCTAVLRSPLVGLSEEALALLRLENPASLWDAAAAGTARLPERDAIRLSRFRKDFKKWRALSRTEGVESLLETILADTDFAAYLSGMPGGNLRRAHVLSLLSAARRRDAEDMSGLPGFLSYMRRTEDSGRAVRQEAAPTDAGNAVRIMTIHKSKGLEFPVVILAATGDAFNKMDLSGTGLIHKDLGLGLCRLEKTQLLRWPTLYWYTVRAAIRREALAEEARLLYVAMTRAKDKLILCGTTADAEKKIAELAQSLKGNKGLPPHLALRARCYLDWILPAALTSRSLAPLWPDHQKDAVFTDDAEPARFTLAATSLANLLTEEEKTETLAAEIDTDTAAALAFLAQRGQAPDWIRKRFLWQYETPGATQTPAKITATAAVRLAQLEKEEETPSVVLADNLEETATLPPNFATPPAFLAPETVKTTGASYGTLMHKAMEILDLAHLTDAASVRAAIREARNKNIFTEDEAKILLRDRPGKNPAEDIARFLQSPLGDAMRNAKRIHKEMPFSLLLPAQKFYPDCEEGEQIFLQGTLDCLLETDTGAVIIDYKTDRARAAEELAAHYAPQLKIYGEAAEKLLAIPVCGLYLWSFALGREIKIEM